jgi:hypothetical protein
MDTCAYVSQGTPGQTAKQILTNVMVTNVRMEQHVLIKELFTYVSACPVSQDPIAKQILTNAAVLRAQMVQHVSMGSTATCAPVLLATLAVGVRLT